MWNVRGRERLFRCVGNTLYSIVLWNSHHPKTEKLKSILKSSMGQMTWPKGQAELNVQAGTLTSVRTGKQKFTLAWSWHNPLHEHGCIWEPGPYSMYNTHSSLLYVADLLSKPSSASSSTALSQKCPDLPQSCRRFRRLPWGRITIR